MKILTVTCWSHKIKYYLLSSGGRTILASGIIERVGLDSSFICQSVPGREPFTLEMDNDDHQSAVALIIATLTDPKHGIIANPAEISAVGHRVAHGGKEFTHSVRLMTTSSNRSDNCNIWRHCTRLPTFWVSKRR